MKTKILLPVLVLFILIGLNSNAQPNTWKQTATPPGGSVWAIVAMGNDLFAGATNGGVYFSSDKGSTWVQRNGAFPNMEVYSLVTNGADVYAGTGGASGGGIYKSSDKGITWTDVSPAAVSGSNVSALVVTATDIYAGTFGGGGIFKSPLTGISTSSWASFNTGLVNQNIRSLALSGTKILAGTYGDGVWISATNIANWLATTGMSSSADYIQALAVHGSNVYAGNISGSPQLYSSTNSGVNWTQSSTGAFLANNVVYALAVNGSDVYAGTEYGGVFISMDNGATWTPYNNGFQDNAGNWYCNNINVRSLAFINNYIFAGTDCGVWKLNNSRNDTCHYVVYDTTHTTVNDTVITYDTTHTTVNDTITTYDTTHTTVNDTVTTYDTVYVTVYDTVIVSDTSGVNSGFNSPTRVVNTIKIFPNPASDYITIDNGNFMEMSKYKVKVINSLGQEVFKSAIDQQQFHINLSTLGGKGIYLVHIIDASGNTTDIRKIVLK